MTQSSINWLVENYGLLIPQELIDVAKEMHKREMIDFAYKYGDETLPEIAEWYDKEYTGEMKDRELLNQVAEKLERSEYTPIVTEKEEMQIWAMLLNKVYEETFNTKER